MSYSNGIGDWKAGQVVPSTATQQTDKSPKTPEKARNAEQGLPADKAQLSTTAGSISAALDGSDVREAKVLELQRAIADGSYKVSSSYLADKILESMTDKQR
jgi:flagellar biosynthesis anti-sigma factor FlgM